MAELEQALNYRAMRHKVIAGNIANMDTPRYESFDLVLRKELERREFGTPEVALERTNPAHFQGGDAGREGGLSLSADPAGPFAIRRDGNTVDPDREMVRLSENTLMYAALSQTISKEFQMLKTAIEER